MLCVLQIINLSSARLPMPKDLLPLQTRENMLKSTVEFLTRHPSGLPLDPETNMGVCYCSSSFIFGFSSLFLHTN